VPGHRFPSFGVRNCNSGFGRAPGCAGVGLRLRSKRYNRLQRSRARANSRAVSPLRAEIPHASPALASAGAPSPRPPPPQAGEGEHYTGSRSCPLSQDWERVASLKRAG